MVAAFRYRVRVQGRRSSVSLLSRFAGWLARQQDGALGSFALEVGSRPGVFAVLPGSRVLLLDHRAHVLLDHRGTRRHIAASLRAFLQMLSRARTGVVALDAGGDRAARAELATWLRLNRIRVRSTATEARL